jgi:hypothetical protein
MLVRDSRTSSANGALGRHERQDSTEDEAWRIATNYSRAARLAAPGGNVKQLRAGLNPGLIYFACGPRNDVDVVDVSDSARRFQLVPARRGATLPINDLIRPHLSGAALDLKSIDRQ